MRIGVYAEVGSVGELLDRARVVEEEGFDSFWLPQVLSYDALSVLTLIGNQVPRIRLGTNVVSTYTRHPLAMASQALTVAGASGGRLTLGIGPSHQSVVEEMYGLAFEPQIEHMNRYLDVLEPLLAGEEAAFEGEASAAKLALDVPGAPTPVPVLLAAMETNMTRLAAERADGVVTWMAGPRGLESHTVPAVTSAAEEYGTGPKQIVAALPVAVTSDVEATREHAAKVFAVYDELASYRVVFEREGVDGPVDMALIGSAEQVAAGISAMRDAGVTEFVGVEFQSNPADAAATRAVMAEFL